MHRNFVLSVWLNLHLNSQRIILLLLCTYIYHSVPVCLENQFHIFFIHSSTLRIWIMGLPFQSIWRCPVKQQTENSTACVTVNLWKQTFGFSTKSFQLFNFDFRTAQTLGKNTVSLDAICLLKRMRLKVLPVENL